MPAIAYEVSITVHDGKAGVPSVLTTTTMLNCPAPMAQLHEVRYDGLNGVGKVVAGALCAVLVTPDDIDIIGGRDAFIVSVTLRHTIVAGWSNFRWDTRHGTVELPDVSTVTAIEHIACKADGAVTSLRDIVHGEDRIPVSLSLRRIDAT